MPNSKAVEKLRKLTDKERLFIDQYFICGLNGTEAALAVYDTTDRHIAASIASENLSKPHIRARVDERLAEYGITANEVIARLAQHARGTMEDFIDPDSVSIDLKKAKAAKKLGLLKKVKYTVIRMTRGEEETETETVEFELYDAQAALVHLGKHLNLFSADTNLNINLAILSDDQLRALASGKKPIDIEAIE